MNTSLMRFSAKRALDEGRIKQDGYSRILARAERIEGQKKMIDERDVGKIRRNMMEHMFAR